MPTARTAHLVRRPASIPAFPPGTPPPLIDFLKSRDIATLSADQHGRLVFLSTHGNPVKLRSPEALRHVENRLRQTVPSLFPQPSGVPPLKGYDPAPDRRTATLVRRKCPSPGPAPLPKLVEERLAKARNASGDVQMLSQPVPPHPLLLDAVEGQKRVYLGFALPAFHGVTFFPNGTRLSAAPLRSSAHLTGNAGAAPQERTRPQARGPVH